LRMHAPSFLRGAATGFAACGLAVLMSSMPPQGNIERRLAYAEGEDHAREATKAFLAASKSHRTDKIYRHAYHVVYGPWLAPYMHMPNVSLLEIGVQTGSSLLLWQRLFKNHGRIAAIGYGRTSVQRFNLRAADSKQKATQSSSHNMSGSGVGINFGDFRLFYGDQSDASFLSAVERDLGLAQHGNGAKFDIIIDDGSHVPWHQIFTLERIFSHWLADGGIYIIEDIETSYWDNPQPLSLFGYRFHAGVGTRGSAVEKLKQVVDVINRKFVEDAKYSVLRNRIDHQVASITFSRNCVGLVKKISEDWMPIDNTHDVVPYRPAQALQKNRSAFLQYKRESQWSVEGTPR